MKMTKYLKEYNRQQRPKQRKLEQQKQREEEKKQKEGEKRKKKKGSKIINIKKVVEEWEI